MKTIVDAVRTRLGTISAAVLLAVLVLALLGPVLAPQDPLRENVTSILQGPSGAHLLGTDYLGRDTLSRLLAGSRLSVFSAFEAVGIGLVLGVLPGITSVYLGRTYEWVTLRVMDSLMALPFMIFAIAVAALLGNALQQAMIAVGILIAPSFYRLTRAAALEHANSQFVTASILTGARTGWVLRKHIWSKVLPTLAVATANSAAAGLLIVSSLTFLGIGVTPPTPTWGGMLASDLNYLSQAPYAPVFPSLMIMITAAALNLLADAVRDTSGDVGRTRTARIESRLQRRTLADLRAAAAGQHPAPVPIPVGELGHVATDTMRADGLTIAVAGGRREVVHSVDLRVPRGSTVGLVGESGSGKTMTCRALLGILPTGASVTAGEVHYEGRDISRFGRREWTDLHGSEIAAVFQDPSSYLNPSIPVGKQLAEVLRVKQSLSRRAARTRSIELFASLGLRHPEIVYTQYPFQLSGGMLQRVLIAIAISCDPDLLIADEATTALDVTVQAEVLEILAALRRERDLTLVMVSHDLAVIAQVCEYVHVFQDGRIVESGRTAEVLRDPQHEYTRSLIESYERYGIDRIREAAPER